HVYLRWLVSKAFKKNIQASSTDGMRSISFQDTPKALNTGTLIDIILTNFPSKYTSAVFNQDLSDHCLIACIRHGAAVKRPPLITVKRSLKHFCEQAFLIDLARVSWKDIDLIPSVEDAWSFFKSN
ncbi:hypothetical protein, partial [Pseudomonas aeruginosa]|uniref:hypothetical protein n=1 Tax=Pseudomonas aeruginosa TaxID=287 RepID=UPI003457D13D